MNEEGAVEPIESVTIGDTTYERWPYKEPVTEGAITYLNTLVISSVARTYGYSDEKFRTMIARDQYTRAGYAAVDRAAAGIKA